jgi:hypothetical protein
VSDPSAPIVFEHSNEAALAHRRVMCGFTLIMMALSWPIWHSPTLVPRFPVDAIEPFVVRNVGLETIGLLVCLTGLAASLASGRIGRFGAAMTALAGLTLVLFDQNRLQAWFYQTLVLSAVYAFLPGSFAIGFVRFFAIVLYVHSALSKLDWSFVHSMGPYLLSPLIGRFPFELSKSQLTWVVLSLPIGELAFALMLGSGYRKIGLIGATIMHAGLLVLLGPWALDHSGNVLLWNASMLVQAWILFHDRAPKPAYDQIEAIQYSQPPISALQSSPAALGLVQLGMLAVALLPFFERAGLWDPWPSFALYAGHVEQLRIDWPAELSDEIPPDYRPFLRQVDNDLVLDLTHWSRALFGVPPYPAQRIHRRLARWIAETCPEGMPMRATFLSKAQWRTGARQETVLSSARSIRNR